MSKLLSEKVKKTPSSEVSEGRYQFIKLAEVEPDLGVPDSSNTTPYDANNYILVSDTDGNRSWTNQDTFVGYTGSRGYTGSIGYTGSQGDIGYTGSQGDTGFTGSFGYTGSKGDTGNLERWQILTSNTTVSDGDRIIADTSGGSFTLTLPDSANTGDYIQITDGADLEDNPVTIDRNGYTIEGVADDILLDVADCTFELIWDGSTWQMTATVGPQGPIGYTGSQGDQGDIGYTGSAGAASTDINATNDTSTTALYPVMVGSAGSGETPKVTTTKLYFDASTGTLNATEINTLSDTKLKENLNTIADPFAVLNSINGLEFSWKETNKKSFGVSAQQVEQVIPELINNSEYKSVNYSGLIPFLIEAVKDLNAKITKLDKNMS